MPGKTILITGCSSGFGKLTVPLLLARGHTVIAALRGGQGRLESLFARELADHPGRLVALDLPLEKPESPEAARALIEGRFGGRLDVLVNNAGYGLFGALEEQTPEQLRYQFEVNFFGPALLARALLPALRAARGRVINISSIAGVTTFPLYGSYCATKYALEGLFEGISYELRPHGVQVMLIEPGGFRTDFSTRSLVFGAGAGDPASPYRAWTQGLRRALERTSARLGDPMRVARLIARSCERRHVPIRKRIGIDAGLMGILSWAFPSRARVWLVGNAFRAFVARER